MKIIHKTTIILLSISILLIAFILLLNSSVVAVRIYELSLKLEQLNKNEKGINYMDVLFKYEINRKLYLGKIKDQDVDIEELKIISAITYNRELPDDLKKKAMTALPVINALRYLIGKTAIEITNKKTNNAFDIAYYYERNGFFKKAVESYDSIESLPETEIPVILLHKGYCYALSGNDKDAEKCLTEIIEKHSTHSIAITAATLLMYIRDFRGESEKIASENNRTLENSIKLIQLTSFDKAFEMLSTIESKDRDTEVNVKYYKARYYEETGDKGKAVEIYQDIILKDNDNENAKKANRRIFLIASGVTDGELLKMLSIENNKFLSDETFNRMVTLSESMDINASRPEGVSVVSGLSEKTIGEYIEQSKEVAKIISRTKKEKLNNKGDYTISFYNKNGEISKIEFYDKNNVLTGYYIYIYDAKGNRIRIDAYTAQGVLMEYY